MDANGEQPDTSLLFDLVRLLSGRSAEELAPARAELERLAVSAKQPMLRQVGLVSLMNVDGTPDKAWQLALGVAHELARLCRSDAADCRRQCAGKPLRTHRAVAGRICPIR